MSYEEPVYHGESLLYSGRFLLHRLSLAWQICELVNARHHMLKSYFHSSYLFRISELDLPPIGRIEMHKALMIAFIDPKDPGATETQNRPPLRER